MHRGHKSWFLVRWFDVHSRFMDLGSLVEIVVHYLIIGGMTCFGCRDKFPMVSTLVSMVTHWTWLMVNHGVRLLIVMIHQAIIMCELSTLRGYWVRPKVIKRCWVMGETPK